MPISVLFIVQLFSHLKAGVPVTNSTYKRPEGVQKRIRNKQRTAERFDGYTHEFTNG
jgi:hypothetical protein